jgi:hypothetical protein
METQKTLTIVAVGELKEAKDTRNYFSITLSPGFGLKPHSINMWEIFLRDKDNNPILDQKKWERGSREEAMAAMKAGIPIAASVVTRTVEPYVIREGQEPVTKYTTVVFGDQDEVKVFANAGHPILDEESGELLGVKKAVLGSANAATAKAPVKAEF